MPSRPRASAPRGFSLLELLVVIGVIVLLIGILVPSLGAVRTAARRTQATALATQVSNSIMAFKADKGVLPGRFNMAAMASDSNWADTTATTGAGFTETENMLLDLVGGEIDPTTTPDPSERVYEVGPDIAGGHKAIVSVNAALAATAGYFKPDAGVLAQVRGQANVAAENFADQPLASNFVDIIDPFGMPLVVWRRNPTAVKNAPSYSLAEVTFADSPNAAFYWNTNAGYLASSALGERSTNQRQTGTGAIGGAGSLFGGDAAPNDVRISLSALVGNPGFASATRTLDEQLPGAGDAMRFALPESFRGDFVVVSAGADRVYFSRKQDPGTSEEAVGASANDARKHLGFVVIDNATSRPQPDSAEIDRFDDIVVSGG